MLKMFVDMAQQPDAIDKVTSLGTKAGAAVAVAPGALSFFDMAWWNENSAGVVAICAAVGAVISVLSYIGGQWHRGNIQRLARRVAGFFKRSR